MDTKTRALLRDATVALTTQVPGQVLALTPALAAEQRDFDARCPYYCDGSRHGVAEYLETVEARTGACPDVVSYAWRTTSTIIRFLARLDAAAESSAGFSRAVRSGAQDRSG